MAKSILYVNPTAIHGGAEEVLLHYMLAARAIGYEPVLIVSGSGWLTKQCETHQIAVELLPTLPGTFFDSGWQQFKPWPLNGLRIAVLARKRRAALIHSNTPRASYHGGLGARLAGIAAVTHVHDMLRLPYASSSKARLLASLTDRTITVSHAVEQAVTALAPQLRGQIQTIYNGFDFSAYTGIKPFDFGAAYQFPANAIVLGNVSPVNPVKGQDVLIQAFQRVYRDCPQTRLVLVGGTQGADQFRAYEAQLRQQVIDAGLQEAVFFTGWREDALSIMRSFDIFIHTPVEADSLPTVLLHASALGRPIIASKIGGIPEIVEEDVTGLLVPPRDVDELIYAIQRLTADEALRAQLGRTAQTRFRQIFSWENMVSSLGNVYCALTERRII